jgi:hypothetical protein
MQTPNKKIHKENRAKSGHRTFLGRERIEEASL